MCHHRRATVLDIGGAAFWLAARGYAVHLIDAAPRLVEKALEQNMGAARPLVSCRVGDARAIAFPDEVASVVLLFGPLYHLVEAADRQKTGTVPFVTSLWTPVDKIKLLCCRMTKMLAGQLQGLL